MSPAAWSSQNRGEIRRKKLLKATPPLWFGPLLLSVQTRAGPLRPYMEEWMTSPASGAQLSPFFFFIVRWWHVWNVMANSLRSRAPPSLPLWPWVSAAAAAAAAAWLLLHFKKKKKPVRYGSTCPASQPVGKLSGVEFRGSTFWAEVWDLFSDSNLKDTCCAALGPGRVLGLSLTHMQEKPQQTPTHRLPQRLVKHQQDV